MKDHVVKGTPFEEFPLLGFPDAPPILTDNWCLGLGFRV